MKARLKNGTALDTSYLFYGGAGQGKTTLARILARALICTNLDKGECEPCNECDNCKSILDETSGAFVELDAASRGGIDNIRSIVDDLPFAVFNAPKRTYLFDECHRLSKDAQDVLLKPLEEKRMIGMFCTTEPDKVRGPIRSRCEDYAIRRAPREEILSRMKGILDKEGVEHEDDAVTIVIDFCGGHVRDVLNKLEMIAQMGPITVASTREYLNLSIVSVYYEILLNLSNPKQAIELVDKACDRVTPEEVASGLAEAAMNSYRLANQMFADFVFVDRALGKQVYDMFGSQTIQLAEYLLRSRRPSQTGLLCDIMTLSMVLGAKQAIPSAAIESAPSVPNLRPLASPTMEVCAEPNKVQSITPTPNVVQKPVVSSIPVGGKDPEALGIYDHHGIKPKKEATNKRLPPPTKKVASGEDQELSPDQWSREFERVWHASK